MTRFHTALSLLITTMLLLSATSCADKKDMKAPEPSVEELYNNAMDKLQKKEYKSAVELFEQVERDYPYSSWSVNAQIMEAYSHYSNTDYDDVINVTDRFIKLHPGNKNIAYIYYLRAVSYYEQISDVARDQHTTELALAALKEVVARFPDSDYARDARVKIDLANDHLAGKEMEIGRFYLKNGNILAATNRFRTVVDQYQTTSHTPEALYRLTAAYLTLGIDQEAQKTAAVLGYNYPASKWYRYSYNLLEKQDKTVKKR